MQEEDLLRLLELPVLVCLDEAYIEFSTEESRASWVLERENLCILRTFSKRAGLAGLISILIVGPDLNCALFKALLYSIDCMLVAWINHSTGPMRLI